MDNKEDAFRDNEKVDFNDEDFFYEKLWEAGILVLTDNFKDLKIK